MDKMARRIVVAIVIGVLVVLLATYAAPGVQISSPPQSLPTIPNLQLDVGKIVIDTDAGVDDAAAILLALGFERVHGGPPVIAITCVQGNTIVDNVAVNVLKILDTVKRLDIPVYQGANRSLVVTPPIDNYYGEDGFGDFDYPNPPSPGEYLQKTHAVNALISLVTEYPGEVTILCIGPLTNIALAIRLDPLFLSKVKNLIVLGGSVEGVGNVLPGIEFNFFVDPEANFIVFNSTDTRSGNIKPVILFPWESVVSRNAIDMDWRINTLGKLNSTQVDLLNKAEAAMLDGLYWRAGDPLVMAVVLNSSLVTTSHSEYMIAHVEAGPARGGVLVDYQDSLGQAKNVIVVKDLEVASYQDMLLASFS